ncbi:hypothetical protein Poly51_49430 [Rubripirellula tenax]|uniref:Uncharacterized protein n=1 Tax=Rubripirellula tenax TaxID=2528015 RepID=A0A5C6EF51_9BACT|nr:hypothetical protein Poly51_49430 [Rubripirellula tenax]
MTVSQMDRLGGDPRDFGRYTNRIKDNADSLWLI